MVAKETPTLFTFDASDKPASVAFAFPPMSSKKSGPFGGCQVSKPVPKSSFTFPATSGFPFPLGCSAYPPISVKAPTPFPTLTVELTDLETLLLLKINSDDESLVKESTKELLAFTSRYPNNCQLVYNLGGHCTMLTVLIKWKENRVILGRTLRILSNLALRVEACRANLRIKLAIDSIAQAMRRFSMCPYIQLYAVRAFSNLIINTDCYCKSDIYATNSAKARFASDLKGVDLLTSAMLKFRDNTELQLIGCHLLFKLCEHKELNELLKTSDAIMTVAMLLKKYPDDTNIRSAASQCMKSLFTE